MSKRLSAPGVTFAAAALALAGCAQQAPTTATIPVAVAYPISTQQKMQAAHHWEVLAGEIARQVGPSATASGRAIYVMQQPLRSPFYEGFRGMLEEALVAQGATVSAAQAGALTLNYRAQVVVHQAPRTGVAAPASDPPTPSELVVTAEIVDGGRLAYKTNRIYYINPDDAIAQYAPPPGRPTIPTEPRTVRVRN